jgi:hypothetical protein
LPERSSGRTKPFARCSFDLEELDASRIEEKPPAEIDQLGRNRLLAVAIGVGVGIALAIIGYLLHWISS